MAHTLTNTTLNLLHVATVDAMNPGMSIRMTTFSIVSLLMMFLIRYVCNRRKMPELMVWKSQESVASFTTKDTTLA
jgi:hypothetical protein